MKKKSYMSWNAYFMSVALLSSFRSKDPKTRTGACIADKNNKIVGIGYNGLPRRLDDNDPAFWADHDDNDIENSKHSYVVHAEKNAIYNSISYNLDRATLYVTLLPCRICAQAIIQVGIKKVVYLNRKDHHVEHNKAVAKMFKAAGVKMESFKAANSKDREFIHELIEEYEECYGSD